MIFLYRFVLLIIGPLSLIGVFISRKVRKGILGRVGLLERLKRVLAPIALERPRFWFHVSSAGEFEQAVPLMDQLKKTDPSCFVVLTYFSPSAQRALELETERRKRAGLEPGWDFSDFGPLDFWWSIKSFLRLLNPQAIIIIHRELWPELIFQANQKGIPVHLWATFFPKVPRYFSIMEKWALKKLAFIGTVDSGTTQRVQQIADRPIKTIGDPRLERILQRKNLYPGQLPGRQFFESQRIWIGASLWDEDFKELVVPMARLLRESPTLRLIFVPHEPDLKRVLRWKKVLKQSGIDSRLWSNWLKSPDGHSHLIVDQVGILAELYSLASFAFVGGSFKSKVHNILEPATFGIPILTGPLITNSAEALELQRRKALTVVQSSEEFYAAMSEILHHPEKQAEIAKRLKEFETERSNISIHYIEALIP